MHISANTIESKLDKLKFYGDLLNQYFKLPNENIDTEFVKKPTKAEQENQNQTNSLEQIRSSSSYNTADDVVNLVMIMNLLEHL